MTAQAVDKVMHFNLDEEMGVNMAVLLFQSLMSLH
jgi:hypothetical protein